jgi:hypothetical protein
MRLRPRPGRAGQGRERTDACEKTPHGRSDNGGARTFPWMR